MLYLALVRNRHASSMAPTRLEQLVPAILTLVKLTIGDFLIPRRCLNLQISSWATDRMGMAKGQLAFQILWILVNHLGWSMVKGFREVKLTIDPLKKCVDDFLVNQLISSIINLASPRFQASPKQSLLSGSPSRAPSLL
jgi:hypothetical protein